MGRTVWCFMPKVSDFIHNDSVHHVLGQLCSKIMTAKPHAAITFSFLMFYIHNSCHNSKSLSSFFFLLIFAVLYRQYYIVNATIKPGVRRAGVTFFSKNHMLYGLHVVLITFSCYSAVPSYDDMMFICKS